jgi:hypothetical protein
MSTMLLFADRVIKTVVDLTIGTVIVLVHVTLAERDSQRRARPQTRQRMHY